MYKYDRGKLKLYKSTFTSSVQALNWTYYRWRESLGPICQSSALPEHIFLQMEGQKRCYFTYYYFLFTVKELVILSFLKICIHVYSTIFESFTSFLRTSIILIEYLSIDVHFIRKRYTFGRFLQFLKTLLIIIKYFLLIV